MRIFTFGFDSSSTIALAINKVAREQSWELSFLPNLANTGLDDDINLLIVDAATTEAFEHFYQWHSEFVENSKHFVKALVLVEKYEHRQAGRLIPFHNVSYVVFPEDYQQLLTHLNYFTGYQQAFKDIALASRNTVYGKIVDNIALVSITNASGRITFANDKFCQISGYSRAELLGKTHSIIKSGFHDDRFYKELWSQISSGKIWKGYFCNRSKPGEEYWVDSVIYPITDPNGFIQQYVSIRYEVTELVNVKNELQHSEERFRISNQYANVGVWDWNITTGELFWSDEVHKLLGFEKPVMDTTYANFLNSVHPEDRDSVAHNVNQCLKTGEPYSTEHRVIWPNGKVRWVLERGDVLYDKYGEPTRMLGAVSDIHELKEAKDKAQAADTLKSDFISMLSHEIRNPLNAIMGYARLLAEMSPKESEQNVFAENINQVCLHIAGILDDVSLNMKLEAGNLMKEITVVSLHSVIEQVLNITEVKDNSVNVEVGAVDGFVLADEQSLRQVLLNLMSNAIKYNRLEGSVFIRVLTKLNGITRIEIEDTGIGIAESEIEKLFEPFERLGMAKTEVEGMGLGLSICRHLVEGMSGTMGVNSDVTQGSTFWVELPSADQGLQWINNSLNTSQSLISLHKERLPKTVLLAEDNSFNQDFMKTQLGRLGIITDVTGNGLEALEKIGENAYDLVLTDLNMPKMDGLTLITHIRQHVSDSIRHLPVIIISADKSEIETFEFKGSVSFLFKPFTQDSLFLTLSEALNGEQPEENVENDKITNKVTGEDKSKAIDKDVLEHYLGTDPQQVEILVSAYLEQFGDNIAALREGHEQRSRDKLKFAAHRLASSSLSVGAKEFSNNLKQIEQYALTDNEAKITERVESVLALAQQVETELTELVARAEDSESFNSNDESFKPIKILIVDDDPFSVQQLQQHFTRIENVDVKCAVDAKEGIESIEASQFDIVILDIDMPAIDGIQFVRLLSEFYNNETLVLYSGEKTLVNVTAELIKSYGFNYLGALEKPVTVAGLSELLGKYTQNNVEEKVTVSVVSDNEIRTLIESDAITVLYQPQISIGNKQVLSVEALSRLNRGEGYLVSPFVFLPRLNELQLESAFAQKVSVIAIEQLAEWGAKGHTLKMAINFSMHALEDLSLPDKLVYLCEKNGVSSELITIEVTESDITKEPKHTLEVISRLKLAGFNLSIDDFGTGYSSMDKLKRLPFDELKLDKSYVLNSFEDSVSSALVTSSLELAQKLVMKTVAEGVETQEVFDFIETAGADFAQGYFFAKPLSANELIKWVEEFHGRE